ncbi:MAG: alpha/beta fold hydrolase [Isosphaeraceae bacterium]
MADQVLIQDRIVEFGGSRIHYLTAGSGPPLVLLHGGGECAHAWRWVLPELARRFRVIAPDFPGSGGSDRPPAGYTLAMLGEFVGGFLNALEIRRAAVAGHSLGGLAAMQFALTDPGRVSALALVASAGLGREIHPVLKSLCSPGFGDWATAWAITPLGQFQRILWRALGSFSRLKRAPAGWLVDQFWLGVDPRILWDQLLLSRILIGPEGQKAVLLDRLPEVSVPTLIVWGESDQILPAAHGRRAAGRIPHSRLATIPDCGHMPHVERPEEFLETVLAFLESSR